MCAIGFLNKVIGCFIRHKSYIAIWGRLLHIIFSWALILYAQFIILSGLYLYDSPMVLLFYLHVGFMIIIGITFEVVFCVYLRNWKYEYINQIHNKDLPAMSIDEFLESDRKIALFDNYVIDISGY